jgi:hypothetical protein
VEEKAVPVPLRSPFSFGSLLLLLSFAGSRFLHGLLDF